MKMKTMGSVVVLSPSEKLASIQKEKYTKPRDGRDIAYVVSDRLGQLEFLGQKLPLLAEAINKEVGQEAWARVSVTALWESADRKGVRAGPWCKGRWRVQCFELERAVEAYEKERSAHLRSVIVAGQPSCYAIRA